MTHRHGTRPASGLALNEAARNAAPHTAYPTGTTEHAEGLATGVDPAGVLNTSHEGRR